MTVKRIADALAPVADEDRRDDILAAILEGVALLREIRDRLPAPGQHPPLGGTTDGRHAALLAGIAAALEELDLPFTASEVLESSGSCHALAEALRVLSLTTSAAIGATLRSLRGRELGGLVLSRDGRGWRLERR